jgi:hypothetical protein
MTATVRQFSSAGPCIALGDLIKETSSFYVYHPRVEVRTRRVGKSWKTHTKPCQSCRDHPRTQYPHGYMD